MSLAARVPPELLTRVRATWSDRARTELRSAAILTRFVGELLGAGEEIATVRLALHHVEDELRHAELCSGLVRDLGGEAPAALPELRDAAGFTAMPAPARALVTSVSMLAVSETLSVAFLRDLHARCEEPAVRDVLAATLEDEDDHEDLGWAYAERVLARAPGLTGLARDAARHAMEGHAARAAAALEGDPLWRAHLAPDRERDLARWGLFSPRRQAAVARAALEDIVLPRLAKLTARS